ncbi:hypothetical protein ACH4OW_32890 [Streptomyces sp. NPDC017056]|uniref:hypothetical protein n=1 Tax=Streptomyces sp. NPDC017056 TaxID=3364973 RepID=UPI0037AFD7C1
MTARLDHADGRPEYQVALQTSRGRGTVHRAYWLPQPGLRCAHDSTSSPPTAHHPEDRRRLTGGRPQSTQALLPGGARARWVKAGGPTQSTKLVTAARDGEPFDEHTGFPASELRAIEQRTTWYDLAYEYLDQRWDRTPGKTRCSLADAFAPITPALVLPGVAYPEPRVLRRALYSWAFNKNAWSWEPDDEWRKPSNG